MLVAQCPLSPPGPKAVPWRWFQEGKVFTKSEIMTGNSEFENMLPQLPSVYLKISIKKPLPQLQLNASKTWRLKHQAMNDGLNGIHLVNTKQIITFFSEYKTGIKRRPSLTGKGNKSKKRLYQTKEVLHSKGNHQQNEKAAH